ASLAMRRTLEYAVRGRVERREERRDRGLRPGGDGAGVLEENRFGGESIENRAGRPFVAIAAEVVRAESVDEHDDQGGPLSGLPRAGGRGVRGPSRLGRPAAAAGEERHQSEPQHSGAEPDSCDSTGRTRPRAADGPPHALSNPPRRRTAIRGARQWLRRHRAAHPAGTRTTIAPGARTRLKGAAAMPPRRTSRVRAMLQRQEIASSRSGDTGTR